MASQLNITITGVPDGTYTTVLDKEDGTRLTRESVTFSSTNTSTVFKDLAVGETVKGYVDDNDAISTFGAYVEGVTTLTTDNIGELYNIKELSNITEIHG